MSTAREPELSGQTVVVIGGSAGIGLETASRPSDWRSTTIATGTATRPAWPPMTRGALAA
jgi:hypothetical protein